MSTDAKKHASIAAGEKPTRAALAAAILSINDIIPVANTTEAAQVVQALAALGQPIATSPVAVARADARGLHRVEITYDPAGLVWLPASGVPTFASKTAADTWASANSALLSVGDIAQVAGVEHRWFGTKWSPLPIAVMRRNATDLATVNAGAYESLSATAGWTSTNGVLRGFTYSDGLVVEFPGWYRVGWALRGTDPASNGIVGIAVNKTSVGGDDLHALDHITNRTIGIGTGTGLVYLSAGDKLTLWGYGEGGATLKIKKPATAGLEPMHWGAEWIRP